MTAFPRISIVTPCFNDVKFIERTIRSIIDQNYPNLEYIVMDGGSTDGSVDIIRKYESYFTYWQSKPDKGMYDAIQQGFERSTGEIMGWINSDDKHQPGSLFTIAQIFRDFAEIEWIQGTPTVVDETDRIFTDPHRFTVDKLFFYRRKHLSTRKFIQQESTFWRRRLWVQAGGFVSTDYRYAGDFDLWIRFFQFAQLYNVNAVLGSFRQTRGGQASSEHMREYLEETFHILTRYPLSGSEMRSEKYIRVFERLQISVANFIDKMTARLVRPSIFRDTLYFNSKEQRLKKW